MWDGQWRQQAWWEIPVWNPDGSFDDSVVTSMEDVEEESYCLCHQLTKGIGGAVEEEPFSARRNGMLVASH